MLLSIFDGTSAKQLELIGSESQMTIEEADEKLRNYCSQSAFHDDTWVVDKVFTDKNLAKHRQSIYFSQVNNPFLRQEIKMWILYRLMKRRSLSTVIDDVTHVAKLANGMNITATTFEHVTHAEVLSFYNLLFTNNEISMRSRLRDWYGVRTFATEMKFETLRTCMNKYVVEAYPQGGRYDNKYIPDDIAVQMDVLMRQDIIPLAYRCIYWSLRLIPNRITEVMSLTTSCLKQITENSWVLTVPTFKQAGSYSKGSVKMIELQNTGIGAFYIQLLKDQIAYTNTLQRDNDFLFYSPVYKITGKNGALDCTVCGAVKNVSAGQVRRFFQKLSQIKQFHDERGNAISITTHQFRHNAITDRLTSGIFRPIDVMGLTAHHNTQMIENSYTHRSAKDLTIEDKPIIFNGRILSNDMQEQAVLNRPFAKRIYHLGVCSDIRDCNCDKSKCLRCQYLIPNADDLEYYQQEMEDWRTKMQKAEKVGNSDFAELCEYWIESYEILINRILNIVSNESEEL